LTADVAGIREGVNPVYIAANGEGYT